MTYSLASVLCLTGRGSGQPKDFSSNYFLIISNAGHDGLCAVVSRSLKIFIYIYVCVCVQAHAHTSVRVPVESRGEHWIP